MKPPAPFVNEPAAAGGLFDFSSTTATRILAVIAAEGTTPFVGAWLRERIAAGSPPGFVRAADGRDLLERLRRLGAGAGLRGVDRSGFPRRLRALIEELQRRDVVGDGALARGPGMPEGDTLATFYYALAVDALVTEEAAIAAQWEALGG